MAFNLKLPVERGKQLQMIAEAEGKTVVDVITDHIRAKVAARVIPDTIPGIEVAKDGPTITIKAQGFEASVPMNEGPTLADMLKGAADADLDPERKRRWVEGLAALSGVKVKRMGAGVKLVSPFTGDAYPLASGVAADLADQIEQAAK